MNIDEKRLNTLGAQFESKGGVTGMTFRVLRALCRKCGGSGIYSQYHGACWRCNGGGGDPTDKAYRSTGTPTPEFEKFVTVREAALAKRREAAATKKANVQAATEAAFIRKWSEKEDGAVVLEMLDSPSMWEVAKNIFNQSKVAGRSMSVKQEALVVNAAKRAKAEVEAKSNAVETEFVGAVGERLRDVELTFERKMSFEGRFGITHMLLLKDATGNIFKWMASSLRIDLSKGDNIKLTGTVKSHDVYNDTKQTVLSRCKIELIEVA